MINKTEQMIYRLGNLDIQQHRLSYQSSTGKLLENGSDDSVLFAREIFVDDKIRTYEGLKEQLERTTAQNNVSDTSMGEIKKILEYAKAELMKASNGTTTSDGLKIIGVNIAGMKQNLYDLANTKSEGEYVFTGSDSSVQPFTQDSNGKVSYVGNNKLRQVSVEEGSYRDRGVTGFDMMMYPSSSAGKGEVLSFKATDRIIDEGGNEWKLNSPTNNTLTKYDLDGNVTTNTIAVSNDGLTPPTYSFTAPLTNGIRFEAKTNIFNVIDEVVNNLKQVDSSGNAISLETARAGVSKGLTEIGESFDAVNVSHAKLGGRNRILEVSLEKASSKLTQFNILSQKIGAADLSKVAMEAKALELTYTALYSTISKTNQLSLVNFLN